LRIPGRDSLKSLFQSFIFRDLYFVPKPGFAGLFRELPGIQTQDIGVAGRPEWIPLWNSMLKPKKWIRYSRNRNESNYQTECGTDIISETGKPV